MLCVIRGLSVGRRREEVLNRKLTTYSKEAWAQEIKVPVATVGGMEPRRAPKEHAESMLRVAVVANPAPRRKRWQVLQGEVTIVGAEEIDVA